MWQKHVRHLVFQWPRRWMIDKFEPRNKFSVKVLYPGSKNISSVMQCFLHDLHGFFSLLQGMKKLGILKRLVRWSKFQHEETKETKEETYKHGLYRGTSLHSIAWKIHANHLMTLWEHKLFFVFYFELFAFCDVFFCGISWMASELSPKFNCCKMEYLFMLRFKGPLQFSMLARVCLSNSFGFVFFSKAHITLVVTLFLEALYFWLRSRKVLFNRFVSLRCSTVTLRGGRACMFLRVDGQRFWFCHLRVIAFSSRAKHMLQILEVLQAVL